MPSKISSPIESLIACRIAAGKVSAMGLDMFAICTLVRAIHAGGKETEKIAVLTGAHVSARTAWGILDKRSDLPMWWRDLERWAWMMESSGQAH